MPILTAALLFSIVSNNRNLRNSEREKSAALSLLLYELDFSPVDSLSSCMVNYIDINLWVYSPKQKEYFEIASTEDGLRTIDGGDFDPLEYFPQDSVSMIRYAFEHTLQLVLTDHNAETTYTYPPSTGSLVDTIPTVYNGDPAENKLTVCLAYKSLDRGLCFNIRKDCSTGLKLTNEEANQLRNFCKNFLERQELDTMLGLVSFTNYR